MCGRYTLTYADLGAVADLLGALLDESAVHLHRPRFNIAPTHACIIARPGEAQPSLVPALWGLRHNGRLIINARSESAPARFRESWEHGRCVVPADGFYEWRGEAHAREPIWFHAEDGKPLLLAAIYEQQPSAPPVFAILTGPARPPVAEVHDRMPILLGPDAARRWLSRAPFGVIHPDAVPLVATPVSSRVNSVTHDDPACLDPPAPPAPRQLSLF
jgi:putative SOS response-associated peptidase YedK